MNCCFSIVFTVIASTLLSVLFNGYQQNTVKWMYFMINVFCINFDVCCMGVRFLCIELQKRQ